MRLLTLTSACGTLNVRPDFLDVDVAATAPSGADAKAGTAASQGWENPPVAGSILASRRIDRPVAGIAKVA